MICDFPMSPLAWLHPENAIRLCTSDSPGLRDISVVHAAAIRRVVAAVVAVQPGWSGYFALPLRYLLLPDASASISASAAFWPQHVMLSGAVFESDEQLREQLVHELAHQWLYLVEELWPLELPSSRRYSLASGTTGRTAREVVGAIHVASALVQMYNVTQDWNRTRELRSYGIGCRNVLRMDDLTSTGRVVVELASEVLGD